MTRTSATLAALGVLTTALVVACVGDDAPGAPATTDTTDGGGGEGGAPVTGQASLALDPATLTFAVTAPGDTSAPLKATVTNKGGAASAPVEKALLKGTSPSAFAIASDGCQGKALGPAESCTIEVSFTPGAEGAADAVLGVGDLSAKLAGTSSVFSPEDAGGASLNAVFAKSSASVHAVGDDGVALVSPGDGTWTKEASPAGSTKLNAVYATGDDYLYVGGDGPFLMRQKPGTSGYETVTLPANGPTAIYALWGTPSGVTPGSVFAFGVPTGANGGVGGPTTGALHLENLTVTTAVRAATGAYDTAGGGNVRLCVAGDNDRTVDYSDARASWVPHDFLPVQTKLYGVWTDGTNVVAVGSGGTILSGTDCGTLTSQTAAFASATFYAVWGSSITDVWAVGSGGTIVHSTGPGSWKAVASGTTKDLRGVHGTSGSNVYVVGDGVVLHKRK